MRYLGILMFLCVGIGTTLSAAQPRLGWLEELARNAENAARRAAEWNRQRAENNRVELDRLHAAGAARNDHPDHSKYQRLSRKIDAAEERDNQWQNLEIRASDSLMAIGADYVRGEVEKGRMEAARRTEAARAFAASMAAQEGITERSNNMWAKLTDRKNIMLWSIALIAIPVTIYGCKLGLDYASSKWGMPRLVRETSRKTFKEIFFGAGKKKAVNLDDIVLAPDLEKQARAIAERTKNKQQYGAPYQNLLMYGPPGTGKTEFAKKLAHYSGMEYAIVDGGSFSQFKKGGRAVTEINKLFDWAEMSSKGLLIFIDEVDSFAPDRSTITDSDELNAINTFIARTGAPSTKCMFVMATNRLEVLDSAIRSRAGRPIKFDLPAAPERAKILEKKLRMYIEGFEGKKVKGQAPIRLACATNVYDESFLKEVAGLMHNFSGRDIEKAVIDMQSEALESDDRILLQSMVRSVTKMWIEKVVEDQKINDMQHKKDRARG